LRIVKDPAHRRVDMWLRAHAYSRRWLADQIGVTPAYIAMIVSGRRKPSLRIAKRIQDVTSIQAVDFVDSRVA